MMTFDAPGLKSGSALTKSACADSQPAQAGFVATDRHFNAGPYRCLLLLFLLCSLARASDKPSGPPVGSAAPAFTLPDLRGRPVRLEDLKGKPLVLNFWAFWCDTWKEEMPHLKELAARQEEMGFRLVAVSVDGTRLREFLKRTKGSLPFQVLLDAGGKISRAYQITRVPTVVIVDANGRVRFTASGYPGNHVVLRELRKAKNNF